MKWPKSLIDYHYWANERLLRSVAHAAPDQYTQSLGHGWGSLRSLVVHMLSSEWIWLARTARGESPRTPFKSDEFPDLAAVLSKWRQVETDWRAFVDGLTEEDMVQTVRYTNTKGEAFENPLGPLLFHVLNHGTHHRGELAAMLSALEIPHDEDDFLFYLREADGR